MERVTTGRTGACVLVAMIALGACRDRASVKKDPTPAASIDAGAKLHAQPLWSKLISGDEDHLPLGVAADPAGNVVVVGRFAGELAPGVASRGSSDAFAVALAADGQRRWARALGGFSWDEANAVAIASNGSTIVGGHVTGSADFGTGSLGAGFDQAPFVVSLDVDGKTEWARLLSGDGEVDGLALAPSGELALAGRALVRGVCKGNADVVAARLKPNGDVAWSTCMDSNGYGNAERVVVDRKGDVIVCGVFRLRLVLGGVVYAAQEADFLHVAGAPNQVFVAKLAGATGVPIWVRAGAGGDAACRALAVDADGAIAIGGYYVDALAFDDRKLPAFGFRDGFVIVFEEGGAPRPSAAIADARYGDSVGGLVFAERGEILVAGVAGKSASLGAFSAPTDGAYVAAFGRNGGLRWSHRFEGGTLTPIGLARSDRGLLTLAGDLFSTSEGASINLGGDALIAHAVDGGGTRFDVFVARLSP